MKRLLLIIPLFLLVKIACAQIEIKLSPLLIAGVGALSVEYGLSEDAGVEWDGWVAGGGFYTYFSGKYYFNPKKGLDRFYGGIFLGGGTDIGAGGGFLVGSKTVSRSEKVLFEIGFGLGRSFDGGVLGAGKLHFGYRL
ncbi:MAG: hypothetical protein R2795_14020 [Saprospiraceae bacterium]